MKPLVSVIVPVCNVEEYLTECLDSILSQTLGNIEIIAVHDGSADSSGSILDDYARKDKRLKVIHKENEGVSEARNEALKHVQGRFVGFVDSDDWIDREMYEVMYRMAVDKKIDIVMCGYVREFADHSRVKNMGIKDGTVIKGKDGCRQFMRKMIGPAVGEIPVTESLDMHGVICNKLYDARILKDIAFCSLKEIGSCEDLLFNLYAFNNAESIMFIDMPYYHCRKTSQASVTGRHRPNLVEQRKRLIDIIHDFLCQDSYAPVFYEALNNRICLGVMGLGLNIIAKDNKAGCIKKIGQMREMLSEEYIANAFSKFDITELPLHWRMFYRFAKNKNGMGFYIMVKAIKLLINIIR